MLERRAAEVCAQFHQTPGDYDKMFAPSFLAQVPAPKLTAIFADYFSKMGRCTQAKQTAPLSAYAGRFDFIFEKGYSVPATLAIDADEPRLLNSLLLALPIRNSATLDEIVNELKTLPGETSLLITSLGKDGTRPIVAYNAEREMAIGSAFKLYILSELVREVGARDKWQYVGFKGGSEPGVLNMTYLLQSTKGEWYALSVGGNNRQAPLQNEFRTKNCSRCCSRFSK
jgi:hypothetical protein